MSESIRDALGHKGAQALDYVARGFAVVPLGSENAPPRDGRDHPAKLPNGRLGKGWSPDEGRPDKWFVGSRDLAHVRSWWTSFPTSNVGVITGTPSALFVIDCDRHGLPSASPSVGAGSARWGDFISDRDGIANFAEWADEHGVDLAGVPCVESAGGGLHYYWRCSGAVPRKWDGWLPAVDFKGSGTYVAAPPTVVDGRAYR